MNKEMLDLYTDYLICQSTYATATGLSALTNNQVSHDKVTRFLSKTLYGSKDLWREVKPSVRACEHQDEGVLSLDDSIQEKAYTDENEIMCWHFSHAKRRHMKGINFLSCLVSYGDVSLPVGFEIVKKDILYSELTTKRVRRKASVSKNELFRNLIKQAVQNNVLFKYVLADSWFGSKDNMNFVHHDMKKLFIFGLKANRLAAQIDANGKRGQFQKVSALALEDGQAVNVCLKDGSFPVQLLKKVFKNEDGSTGVLYLVTNHLDLEPNRMYEVYQKRWRIEEYHKSIKQNASLAKSPTKTLTTQANHVFASIWAFCKLEMLKIKTKLNHFAIKYKLILRANYMALAELKKMKNLQIQEMGA